MRLKGQIGVEHTALLSVVFTILIVGFLYFASTGEEYQGLAFRAITTSEGNKLIDAIDKAPILGDDSIQTIILDLPEDFKGARLSSPRTLVMDIDTKEGIEQLVFVSKYDIVDNGIISELKPGNVKVYVVIVDGGVCLSQDTYCGVSCGNGIAEDGELCDQNDLRGATCSSVGYSGNGLVCTSDCQGLDASRCNP